MPSRRTKEDTWKEEELLDAIQGSDRKKKSSSSKSSKSGESSRHRSKEEKEREKEKHRRSEAEGGQRKEGERKEKEKKRERSEHKDKDSTREHGEKSRRRHKDEDGETRKEDKEKSSRKKEDRIRIESEEDRARRKERERSEDKHRERKKDKENRKDRHDEESKDKEKKRKHKSDEREGSKNKEDHRAEKRSEAKEERKKHRSSKKGDKEHEDTLESPSKSKSKSRKSRYEEKKGEEDAEKETRRRDSEKPTQDKKRSIKVEEGSVKFKETKQDSFQNYDEEIEEETIQKRPAQAPRKSSILNTEEVHEEEIANNDYEYDDDFEDYDDDFEEDDADSNDGKEESNLELTNEEIEGVDEIRKAILEENKLAESINSNASSSQLSSRDEKRGYIPASISSPATKSQSHGRINFVAAKQKQLNEKAANKTRQRGKELSKLIELDVIEVDLFELQPLNIYEVYMKNFGRMNTEQIAVQTNEDIFDKDIQTDDIETETRWSQYSNEVQSHGGGEEKAPIASSRERSLLRQDMRRLNKFLDKAAQVCVTLLNEAKNLEDNTKNKHVESQKSFSDSFVKLDMTNDFINGRKMIGNDVSQSNLVLLAYGKLEKEKKESLSPEGMVCVWSLNNSSEPQKYLTCGSVPKCCCFSPKKASIAFAGMEDGSVSVWDLREPDSMHRRRKLGKTEAVLRSETFSTASVFGDESHSSRVISIAAITSPNDNSDSNTKHFSIENSSDGALQIASLDENGTVNIWVVIDVFNPDPGGSPQDLGLQPGGRIKLIKSGSILPQMPKMHFPVNQIQFFNATTLHIEPNQCKSIFVGTDQGIALHTSKFGDKVNPKYFGVTKADTTKVVSSIAHCPWTLPYILVGYADGSVSLFSSVQVTGLPLITWPMLSHGTAILKVQWSPTNPGVFFTLDSKSYFCVWDLHASHSAPIMKDVLKSKVSSSAVDFFAMIDSMEKNHRMIIFYDDGTIEVHRLKKAISSAADRNVRDVCELLEELS